MGYEFDLATQQISYGNHVELYQAQDLAIGFWVKFLPAFTAASAHMLNHEDSFPCITVDGDRTVSLVDGYGFSAYHTKGGSATFGVTCIPGLVDSRYKLLAGTWRYFGVTRVYDGTTGGGVYYSYFGSKRVLIDGPVGPFLPAQAPYPLSQPGQNLGPWVLGHQVAGAIIGPASYWDYPLSKKQHLSMANCTLPDDVNPIHLLWWSKMLEGAADIGPNHFAATFTGDPLYVPDDGCVSFGAGDDYRLYNG